MRRECEEPECAGSRSAAVQRAAAQCYGAEYDEAHASDRAHWGPSHRRPPLPPTPVGPAAPRPTGHPSHWGPSHRSVTLPTATPRTGARPTRPAAFRGAPLSRGATGPTGIRRTGIGTDRPGGSQWRWSHCDRLVYPPSERSGAKSIHARTRTHVHLFPSPMPCQLSQGC